MYQEDKNDLKIWLLNNITDLLVDKNTKPEERKVLLNAKHQLETGESANYVCNLIRVGLDPLSWQSKLSKGVTKFTMRLQTVLVLFLIKREHLAVQLWAQPFLILVEDKTKIKYKKIAIRLDQFDSYFFAY